MLILLTPHRPTYGDQLPAPINNLAAMPSLVELQKKAEAATAANNNIATISQELHTNPHYLAYRSGDVSGEYWIQPRSLNKTMHEALSLLYF